MSVRARHTPGVHNWTCELCTFTNNGDKPRCDMCLTAKPAISQSSHDAMNGDRNANTHNENENGKVPNGSIVPRDIVFSPKNKAISEQSIFERWMIAQMQRSIGEQPTICIENNVFLSNLRRVRGPTTYRSLQQQINDNTDAVIHANNLEAGDFTDDEEEELSTFATSPPPSPNHQMIQHSRTLTTEMPMPSGSDHEDSFSLSHTQPRSHSRQNSYNRPLPIAKSKSKHRQSKSTYNISNSRAKSHDPSGAFMYNHKKYNMLNQPRRPKPKRATVSQLWFKAQSQLQQGRNPALLVKYNITLSNIRQQNPHFKDYQRRKSQHEKAASYLHNVHRLNATHRISVIAQDDDDEEDTEYDDEEEDDTSYEYVYDENESNDNESNNNESNNNESNNNQVIMNGFAE